MKRTKRIAYDLGMRPTGMDYAERAAEARASLKFAVKPWQRRMLRGLAKFYEALAKENMTAERDAR